MDQHLIYDVGAHKGEDTEFYLSCGFRVVAVEANPKLAEAIRERFASAIASGDLVVLQVAIAESEGTTDFYENKLSVWGTINPTWAERNKSLGAESRVVPVPTVKFESILREYGVPYYLKVDIEGSDLLCMEALQDFPTKPRFLSIESDKVSWKNLLREFELFRTLGYTRFQVVDQREVEHQRVQNFRFKDGSSGRFGDMHPFREWLTEEQAIAAYRRAFIGYRLKGDNTIGNAVLTKTPILRFVGKTPVVRRAYKWLRPTWYDTHAMLG
jgi:FkbM family methyltransferase